MAYDTSNPPQCLNSGIGGNGNVWYYRSADQEAAYDDTDYITNAADLGMKSGDVVIITDTTGPLASIGKVILDADGNGTLTALTAIS